MRVLLPGFIFIFILLLLYSYTQIDLSLFLSRYEPVLSFQQFFQHIGYFQRPLSTYFYLGLLGLLFILYFSVLNLACKGKVYLKDLWKIAIAGGIILTFSYNAFSYDLFNYIFDAKIVAYYQQNPYEHKALDYSDDPMLNFMHWTHRTYPYGPVWLVLTVPLSFLGMNFFLPTALLFKALASAAYLGTTYYLEKILSKTDPKNLVFGLVFFALNPLVIIEALISAHLDIVMIFFAVFALYYLLKEKRLTALFLLLLSAGVKFATGFLFPIFILYHFGKSVMRWEKLVLYSVILLLLAVLAATVRTNFQPWYLLSVLPFASLLARKYYIFIPSIVLSFASLLIYVPYLYTGNWDPPIPTILSLIISIGIITSVTLVGVKAFFHAKIRI